MNKQINIKTSIAGAEYNLDFNVTLQQFNKYMDAMSPSNKMAPSHNFVRNCFTPAEGDTSKDVIDAVLKVPGAGITLAGELVEDYMPEIEIISKNSNGELPA